MLITDFEVQECLLGAENGNAEAQFRAGRMFCHGVGVTQDFAAALDWFCQSADQGFVAAQFALGEMYREGKGVEKSAAIADLWALKAILS